jgi:hypothetical protein
MVAKNYGNTKVKYKRKKEPRRFGANWSTQSRDMTEICYVQIWDQDWRKIWFSLVSKKLLTSVTALLVVHLNKLRYVQVRKRL